MALYDGTNGPTITVYLDNGVGSGYFVLGTSVLATNPPNTGAKLHTYTPFGQLIAFPSTDVRRVSIRRGRTREDQTFQPATATITFDNRSGNYDPQMLYSSYTNAGVSLLAAGTAMRVTATWSGTEYALYSGFIEQVDIDQSLDSTVTFTCVDGMKQLSNATTLGWSVNPVSTTNTAVFNNLLLQAGWQGGTTILDDSNILIAGTKTFTDATSIGTVLDTLAQSQGGRYYVDRSGKAVFESYANTTPATTSLYLSDQRTSGTIEYDSISITPGSKYLLNTITFTNGADSYTATNTASITQYGEVIKSQDCYYYSKRGSLISGLNGAAMQYLADHFATPVYRVDSVEFDVMNLDGFGGSVWPSFLSLGIGQRVSVARTPVYTTAQTYDCIVQSVDHDITPDNWRTSLQLSPSLPAY